MGRMRPERVGLLLSLAGFVSLSLGDAVVKSMAGLWPSTAIALLRYALGASVLAAMLVHLEGPRQLLHWPRPGLQLLRGLQFLPIWFHLPRDLGYQRPNRG